MVTPTPCSGPRTSPRASALSASAARRRAPWASSVTTAPSSASSRAIRSSCSASTSAADTCLPRIASAICTALAQPKLVTGPTSPSAWRKP
jgi:hypothetical protein